MMIVVTWIVYCGLIAGVLTAAAWAWEVQARWSGRSARWGWLAALAGSVTVPWLGRLIPTAAAESFPVGIPVIVLDAVTLEAASGRGGLSATEAGLAAWVASSVLVLLYIAFALVGLMRERRRWREAELEGGRVLLTSGVGPAAIGVREGLVLIPTWALHMEAELRSLLLRHEREHVRAGDPRLLLGGLVLLATMPWNPFVWLQVLRLRNAIELDCDTRVLAAGGDPERYGSLLLEVSRRRSSGALVMATFAEPRVFLEERIRRIAHWPPRRRPVRAVIFALLGLALFGTAMCAPDPLRPRELPTEPVTDPVPVAGTVDDVTAGPTFTPMTVRPELQNRADVAAALEASYPPLLRDAGIGGAPVVWLLVDEQGSVGKLQLSRSSGYPALDQAALGVASRFRFSPAQNRGERVAVWIEVPIVFSAGDADATRAAAGEPVELRGIDEVERAAEVTARLQAARRSGVPAPLGVPKPGDDISAGPVFTPMTDRPELQNRQEVARALLQAYPPLLRDAGIGGAARIWFFIDETGAVRKTQLSASTGYPALDEAALQVASRMQFTPAGNNGVLVPVWVEIPVVFSAR
jgi:TonB family protein